MKRIGITQRISLQIHQQPHDCLDTAWTDLLLSIGLAPAPLPSLAMAADEVFDYLSECRLDGLVISGGNAVAGFGDPDVAELAPRRDAFEATAIDWAIARDIPTLAVCRGLQFLNVHLGGTISPVDGHVGQLHHLTRGSAPLPPPFVDLPARFDVNSFHNFAISADELATDLRAAAHDGTGHIEAVFHAKRRIAGIMWHPERANPGSAVDARIIAALFD